MVILISQMFLYLIGCDGNKSFHSNSQILIPVCQHKVKKENKIGEFHLAMNGFAAKYFKESMRISVGQTETRGET